jgi:hypothetical protein
MKRSGPPRRQPKSERQIAGTKVKKMAKAAEARDRGSFVGCYVDDSIKAGLETLAENEGMTVAELLRDMIQERLEGTPAARGVSNFKKAANEVGDKAEDLISQIIELQQRKQELDDLIRKNDDFFSGPPQHLKVAREHVESKLKKVAEEIDKAMGRSGDKNEKKDSWW